MENTQRENDRTDLREAEWAVMEALLGGLLKLGRPPRYDRREVFNAIFYLVSTGGSWRLLPNDLVPWPIVYYYYTSWREEGLWQKFHDALREVAREKSDTKSPNRCDIR